MIAKKKSNKTVMASKHNIKTLFDIIKSCLIKIVFMFRFICYYDAKGIIWSAFVIYSRLKILIFVNLAYYIILSYTIGKGIVISFFISHLVRSKFTFYWFSIFWFVSMKKMDCFKKYITCMQNFNTFSMNGLIFIFLR